MSYKLDDRHDYYSYYSKVCSFCKHYKPSTSTPLSRKCAAFPDEESIPDEIWFGKNKHLKKYKNQDNDIIFEERK